MKCIWDKLIEEWVLIQSSYGLSPKENSLASFLKLHGLWRWGLFDLDVIFDSLIENLLFFWDISWIDFVSLDITIELKNV